MKHRVHAVERWNQGDLYAGWLDADNDGRLDLLLASGDYPDAQLLRLFRQVAGGDLRDETAAAGLRWDNCTQPSLADYDRVIALAAAWGSRVVDLGKVGHLNPASGFGEWPHAFSLIEELAATSVAVG